MAIEKKRIDAETIQYKDTKTGKRMFEIELSFEEEDHDELMEYCINNQISPSEVLRQAILTRIRNPT
jgi:hypothetical protein